MAQDRRFFRTEGAMRTSKPAVNSLRRTGVRIGWLTVACLLAVGLDVIGARIALPDEAHVAATGGASHHSMPVWKTITIGAQHRVDGYRQALDAAGMKIGDSADEILGRPAFAYERSSRSVDLVVLSLAELGVETDGATISEVYRRAMQRGLELCPAEVGPQLRLDHREQKLGDFLNIAMTPVNTYDGTPTVLTLANGGSGLLLIGRNGDSSFEAPRSWRFVFVLPSAPHQSAQGRWTETR
jgi:hypothetical protein